MRQLNSHDDLYTWLPAKRDIDDTINTLRALQGPSVFESLYRATTVAKDAAKAAATTAPACGSQAALEVAAFGALAELPACVMSKSTTPNIRQIH
jgi:hypothetical protein